MAMPRTNVANKCCPAATRAEIRPFCTERKTALDNMVQPKASEATDLALLASLVRLGQASTDLVWLNG